MKSIVHNQPNNSAIFTAFNESLFAEIWRETSTHILSNAVKLSIAGFDILVSIPTDIYDMATNFHTHSVKRCQTFYSGFWYFSVDTYRYLRYGDHPSLVIDLAICLSFNDLCCGLFVWHLVMTSSQLLSTVCQSALFFSRKASTVAWQLNVRRFSPLLFFLGRLIYWVLSQLYLWRNGSL